MGIDKNTVCNWMREYRKQNLFPTYVEEKRNKTGIISFGQRQPIWTGMVLNKKVKCGIICIMDRFKNAQEYLSMTTSKTSFITSYGFAAINVVQTIISCFARNPIKRAAQRGYSLQ